MKKIAALVGLSLITLLLAGCGDPKYGEFFSEDKNYAMEVSEKKIIFVDGNNQYVQNGTSTIDKLDNQITLVASLDDYAPVAAVWNPEDESWTLTTALRLPKGSRVKMKKK